MDTEYNNFLANKNVVIVGGHDASVSSICEDVIAVADTVIRINDHWARQGGACDVLYYSCDNKLDIDFFNLPSFRDKIQWMWLNRMHTLFDASAGNFYEVCRRLTGKTLTKTRYFYQAPEPAFAVFEKLRLLPPEYDWNRALAQAIQDSPLTGMVAVEHMRLSKAKSIHITGMNFYTHDPAKTAETKTHNFDLQKQWLQRVVRWDRRFSVSPELALILDEDPS